MLEVVETPPNSSPSFLKKLPNKVIELLSLPLLYSPSFFKLPNRPLRKFRYISMWFGGCWNTWSNSDTSKLSISNHRIWFSRWALFAGFCLGHFFSGWDWVDSLSGYTKRLSKNLEDLQAVCEEIIEPSNWKFHIN